MSSPVERYVPFHKRTPSASSMTSSTGAPVLSYTRDELLALAPSTSTSHTPEAMAQSATEHTYLHPQPHQGWAALNTAMRGYLRLSCPEIVMNRKMRKSVEYQHFQQRSSQRARSNSPSARSSASEESSSSPRRERKNSKPTEAPLPQWTAVARSTPIKPAPAAIKKRSQPRRTRSGATSNARARFNSFNAFHKQLAGAGVDSEWRRTTVTPLPVAAL